MTPADDHRCTWRDDVDRVRAELAQVTEKLAAVEHELADMKRRTLGRKSEKMPRPEDELRRKTGERPSKQEIQQKRKVRAEARLPFEWFDRESKVPADQRCCPHCSGAPAMVPLATSEGRVSMVSDFEPGHFVGERRKAETLACPKCDYIVSAAAPDRVGVGRRYGPGFIAYVITAKCADSIPIYRLAKRFQREGVPMARQTMNDLLHAAAFELRPIADRILELVRIQEVVQADETSFRVQKRRKRAFLRIPLHLGTRSARTWARVPDHLGTSAPSERSDDRMISCCSAPALPC